MNFIKTLSSWEKEHCISGRLPGGQPSRNSELYIRQVNEWDARKSEAIALTENVNPLLKARSFIMRGKLKSAQDLLLLLWEESRNDLERTEIQLEQARVANAQGDWERAAALANQGLDGDPSAVSRLTFYQIRALACFELGRISEALADLENAESLCEIFPNSIAGFYARVSKAKVLARARGVETGRRALDNLWQAAQLNADSLLTLLRAEIDIRRLEVRPILDLCIYSYNVAQRLGDLLYSNLALIDIYYSIPFEDRASLHLSINQAKEEFIRCKILCDEIENDIPCSTTALTIRLSDKHAQSERNFSETKLRESADALLIFDTSKLFHFELNKLREIESGKTREALLLLVTTPQVTKSEFFSHLWGRQKYTSRLHDNLIWNLVSRMRKSLSIDIKIEDEKVTLKSRVWRLEL